MALSELSREDTQRLTFSRTMRPSLPPWTPGARGGVQCVLRDHSSPCSRGGWSPPRPALPTAPPPEKPAWTLLAEHSGPVWSETAVVTGGLHGRALPFREPDPTLFKALTPRLLVLVKLRLNYVARVPSLRNWPSRPDFLTQSEDTQTAAHQTKAGHRALTRSPQSTAADPGEFGVSC